LRHYPQQYPEDMQMIDVLLPVVLLVGVATLAVAIGAFRSSRRSEDLGENRYELLREQQERLQVLREERQMFLQELEREALERRRLMEILEGEGSQLAENLIQERQKRAESAHRTKQLEQDRLRLEQELQGLQEELERERRQRQEVQRHAEAREREHTNQSQIKQKMERLEQERQRLTEELDREREGRAEIQRQAERRDQERIRLERELERLQAELDRRGERAPVPEQAKNSEKRFLWQSRPFLVAGLLLGVLVAWFVSLMVALSLLAP